MLKLVHWLWLSSHQKIWKGSIATGRPNICSSTSGQKIIKTNRSLSTQGWLCNHSTAKFNAILSIYFMGSWIRIVYMVCSCNSFAICNCNITFRHYKAINTLNFTSICTQLAVDINIPDNYTLVNICCTVSCRLLAINIMGCEQCDIIYTLYTTLWLRSLWWCGNHWPILQTFYEFKIQIL